MNAIALVLCSVIAGADARETIPDAQKMYNVLGRAFHFDEQQKLLSVDGGLSIQPSRIEDVRQRERLFSSVSRSLPQQARSQSGGAARPILFDNYLLRIVPIPDHPECLIAGYVAAAPKLGWEDIPFAVVIDTERNLVCNLDNTPINRRPQRNSGPEAKSSSSPLTQEELELTFAKAAKLAERAAQQVTAKPQKSPFADQYSLFRRHFIRAPQIDVTCVVTNQSEESFQLTLQLSAEHRQLQKSMYVSWSDLLNSDLSLSADAYFQNSKPADEESSQ